MLLLLVLLLLLFLGGVACTLSIDAAYCYTDVARRVVWMSGCWPQPLAAQKNGWVDRCAIFGTDYYGPRKHVGLLDGSPDAQREGTVLSDMTLGVSSGWARERFRFAK